MNKYDLEGTGMIYIKALVLSLFVTLSTVKSRSI